MHACAISASCLFSHQTDLSTSAHLQSPSQGRPYASCLDTCPSLPLSPYSCLDKAAQHSSHELGVLSKKIFWLRYIT